MIIAERKYTLSNDIKGECYLRVYQPVQIDCDTWSCRVTVIGLKRILDNNLYGVDSIQPLVLALNLARAFIQGSSEYRNGAVSWLDENSDLGLLNLDN